MPIYPVNQPLKHDGAAYAPGETVEMEAKAAKDLLLLGVLGPAVKAAPKAATKTETKTQATETGPAAAADQPPAEAAASSEPAGEGA